MLLLNSFWIILFHTFLSKFKTKSFLITTAITLLFVVALTNLTTIIDTFSGEEGKTEVAVIDQSDSLLPIIQEATKTLNEDLELVPYKDSEESAKKEVEEGNYSGLLVVDVDSSNLPIATYYTMDIAETSISDNITNGIQMVKSQLAANQLNLTNEQLAKLNEPVSFEKIALEKDVPSSAY